MCDCDDATVYFNFYIYLVFVGECLALVPSHLPHLRRLCLDYSDNVRDEYLGELMSAVPELKVSSLYESGTCRVMIFDRCLWITRGYLRNRHLETTYNCSTSDSDDTISQRELPNQSEDCSCNH